MDNQWKWRERKRSDALEICSTSSVENHYQSCEIQNVEYLLTNFHVEMKKESKKVALFIYNKNWSPCANSSRPPSYFSKSAFCSAYFLTLYLKWSLYGSKPGSLPRIPILSVSSSVDVIVELSSITGAEIVELSCT